jgi:hypothetical protein
MTSNRQALGRLAALLALGLAVQALLGCGQPAGSVSGKVTLKGQPMAGGTVTFLGADDRGASSPIEPDGTYTVSRVAVGVARIAVSPPASGPALPKGVKMDPGKMGAPAGAAPADPPGGKKVFIAEQYQDPTKSGLTYEVKAGRQDYNIDLK